MRKKLALFIILYSIYSFGQTSNELFFKVLESKTKSPISFATVQFKDANNGVITNYEGDFRIPLSYKKAKMTLLISCIGYETQAVNLEFSTTSKINIIYLNPKTEELDLVYIKGKKAKQLSGYEIIKKAITSIPQNYPNTPYSMISYYRDYHTVGEEYYNVNEAIIESFDAGFSTDIIMDSYNQAALFKYNENKSFKIDSSLIKPYDGKSKYIDNVLLSGQGGNELGVLKIHDPIRNYAEVGFSFVDVFKTNFLENHELINTKTVYLNNEKLYRISFKTSNDYTGINHSASGYIYIAKKNFAIYKFEYKVFGREQKTPAYKVIQIEDKTCLYEVTVEYKPKNDKMYLSYITYNNRFVTFDDSFFNVDAINYEADKGSFFVTFNSPILESSVSRKKFKFRYQDQKLLFRRVKIVDSVTVKLELEKVTIPDNLKLGSIYLKDAVQKTEYDIKNIYDINKRKLYKAPKIIGYHYRELFTQEVFDDKKPSKNMNFIDKKRPIKLAPINTSNIDVDKYWINSPLKQTISN